MSSASRQGLVFENMVRKASSLDPFWFAALAGLASVIARLPVATKYVIPTELRPLKLPGILIPSTVMAFVVLPLTEAFLGQWLPVRIASWLDIGLVGQCILAALAFSALHLHHWLAAVTAFLPGLVFAVAYVAWKHRSRSQAFWLTAFAHVWEIAFVLLLRRFF